MYLFSWAQYITFCVLYCTHKSRWSCPKWCPKAPHPRSAMLYSFLRHFYRPLWSRWVQTHTPLLKFSVLFLEFFNQNCMPHENELKQKCFSWAKIKSRSSFVKLFCCWFYQMISYICMIYFGKMLVGGKNANFDFFAQVKPTQRCATHLKLTWA